MKKIYVIYGGPKSGKSSFIREFITTKGQSYLETDENLNRVNFIKKYSGENITYKNVVIDNWNCIGGAKSVKAQRLAASILACEEHFDNLFIICHEKEAAYPLTQRFEDQRVIIKYLDFNDINTKNMENKFHKLRDYINVGKDGVNIFGNLTSTDCIFRYKDGDTYINYHPCGIYGGERDFLLDYYVVSIIPDYIVTEFEDFSRHHTNTTIKPVLYINLKKEIE